MSAAATLETPYGRASSSWRREGARLLLDVVVPSGVTAEVQLPDGRFATVASGTHQFECELEVTATVDAG